MNEYTRLDMRTLLNAHTVIRRGDEALVIAGVTDLTAVRTGATPPDVKAAIAGAPSGAPIYCSTTSQSLLLAPLPQASRCSFPDIPMAAW